MQASSATKDGARAGPYLNWRHRKKAIASRNQVIHRRRELIDGYIAELGGIERVTALVRVEIERVADMMLLAEGMRGKALRGEAIDIGDLMRLEGVVSRLIRSLGLPAPGAAPVMGLHDIVRRAAEEAD
jgi:hypothetical protein